MTRQPIHFYSSSSARSIPCPQSIHILYPPPSLYAPSINPFTPSHPPYLSRPSRLLVFTHMALYFATSSTECSTPLLALLCLSQTIIPLRNSPLFASLFNSPLAPSHLIPSDTYSNYRQLLLACSFVALRPPLLSYSQHPNNLRNKQALIAPKTQYHAAVNFKHVRVTNLHLFLPPCLHPM